MQTAESIVTILADNFVLVDGEMTAYAPDGDLVGVSKTVPSENGLLSFRTPAGNLEIGVTDIYCELVSCRIRISQV